MATVVLVAEQQWWGAPWPDALVALSTAVVAAAAAGGVGAVLSVRRAVADGARTRRAALEVELSRRWGSRDLREVRAEIAEMTPEQFRDHMHSLWRGPGEPQWQLHRRRHLQVGALGDYFEDLAVLVVVGSIDLRWIDMTVGDACVSYWTVWALHVQERRDRADTDLLYEHWQRLAGQIADRRAGREGLRPGSRPSWRRRPDPW